MQLGLDPVVLTGVNGAGKTNVLEALSMLSPGKGMRQATISELSRQGGNGPWAVAARLHAGGGEVALGTGLIQGEGERRSVHIDGAVASGPGAMTDYVRIGWLTPAMDRLFSDAASGRRRFLDRLTLLLHPDHGRMITAYEKAMRERNALLDASPRPDPAWAQALENQMAEHAIAIAAARRDMVQSLSAHIAQSPDGPFPKATLALEGDVERDLEQLSAVAAEDAFKERLARNRALDAAAKRTLIGPHRSDLIVTHQAKNMAASLCSTGEQKALLVGLILAHADLARALGGPPPILLLDEIAAHLDRLRRAALFERLCEMPAQCWLTGTDAELFEALEGRAQFFTVFDGQILERNDTSGRGYE